MKPTEKAGPTIVALVFALSVTAAGAQQRTFHVDKYGAKEYSKGHYETDSSGRTYHVDKYGAKEYSKGHYETDKNGVTVRVDRYGAKQYSEGTFLTEKPKGKSDSAPKRK